MRIVSGNLKGKKFFTKNLLILAPQGSGKGKYI